MRQRKRITKSILTIFLTIIMVASALVPSSVAKAEVVGSVPIYRLYNPDNGEHLYTTDANERDVLFNSYGWGYEGVAWYSATSGTPVYRLYNNVLCNHLYTTDLNEITVLTSMENTAWTIDNNAQPLFYSNGVCPIYRVYNAELKGMHHLTTDKNEYDVLPTFGWAQEGISLYAVAVGNPILTKYADTKIIETTVEEMVNETTNNNAAVAELTYVLNTNTMKFHRPNCTYVEKILDSHRIDSAKSRDEIIAEGYEACKKCKP